ncbi:MULTISPECIES: putative metalloprotease CJM1_0395 family protein [Deferrisoma]
MRVEAGVSIAHGGNGARASQVSDPQVRALLAELRRTDREVRAHEAAHAAAGGGLVRGGPSFRYRMGPDGRPYAVAGEVQIDSSPEPGDPEATIAKMERVRRAALAPARPSAQDLAVAAQAAQTEARARAELLRAPDGDPTKGNLLDVKA